MILNVLFVDDDNDDYEIFSDVSKEINPDIKVTHLQDGSRIEEIFNSPPPDIIFLDYNMPKMDGLKCLKLIRANKAFDKTPVIMHSVYYDKAEEAFKNGATSFVVKQIYTAKMKKVIQRMLERDWKDESIFKTFDIIHRRTL